MSRLSDERQAHAIAVEMRDEAEAEVARLRAENEALRVALEGVFGLVLTADEIRPDCKQMLDAGKLLGV